MPRASVGRLDGAEQVGRGPGDCVFTVLEAQGHLPAQCCVWWGSRSDWGGPWDVWGLLFFCISLEEGSCPRGWSFQLWQ